MEITRGIHLTPAGAGARAPGAAGPPNAYLALGNTGTAFIDTGYAIPEETQARLDYLAGLDGPPIKAIIVTHRHGDHMGGAAHIHKASGGGSLSTPTERPSVDTLLEQTSPDLRVHHAVEDGETLDLGGLTLEFIHAPGHTLGSLAVLARETGVLFTGDNILGHTTPSISAEQGDMALYLQTLGRLLTYDLDIICPGHGPMVAEPRQWLQKTFDHRLEREQQVLQALKAGKRTIEQLRVQIYPYLDSKLHHSANNQVRCHLIKLEREGRVRAADDSYALTE